MNLTCPRCSKVIEGDLTAVTRHVQGCGRRVKATQVVPVNPSRNLPSLPVAFQFCRQLLSQNIAKASHWRVYHSDVQRWGELVRSVLRDLVGLQLSFSRWQIVRLYEPPKREFDYGNLVGGAKPLPDALVKAGVIVDDSPKFFRCSYDQQLLAEGLAMDDTLSPTTRTVLRLLEAQL